MLGSKQEVPALHSNYQNYAASISFSTSDVGTWKTEANFWGLNTDSEAGHSVWRCSCLPSLNTGKLGDTALKYQSAALIPEAKDFLFLRIVHTACGAHLTFYSLGIEVTSLGVKWPGRELTTYLRLMLGLRTSGPWTSHTTSCCWQVQHSLFRLNRHGSFLSHNIRISQPSYHSTNPADKSLQIPNNRRYIIYTVQPESVSKLNTKLQTISVSDEPQSTWNCKMP